MRQGSCEGKYGKFDWTIDDQRIYLRVTPRGFENAAEFLTRTQAAAPWFKVGEPDINWSVSTCTDTRVEDAALSLSNTLEILADLAFKFRLEFEEKPWDAEQAWDLFRKRLGLHEDGRPMTADRTAEPGSSLGAPYPVVIAIGLPVHGGDAVLLEAPPMLVSELGETEGWPPDDDLLDQFPGPGVYRCTLQYVQRVYPATPVNDGEDIDTWWEAANVERIEAPPGPERTLLAELVDAYVEETGEKFPTNDSHPLHAARRLTHPEDYPED